MYHNQLDWQAVGSARLCFGGIYSAIFEDGREHESDYIDLLSLSLEQNRGIQRSPQTPFLKEIAIIFQQSISFLSY